MALLGANLDYTEKDFDSLRDRLFNLISGAFPGWTERSVANFGNILVELFAHVGDVLVFYQDNQANESRITSAQLRRSLLALSKLVGYTAPGQTAATSDLQVVLTAVPGTDAVFAIGSTFRTAEVTTPVVFQLLAETTMTAGTDPPVITLVVENSSGGNILLPEDTVASTGLPNQEYILQKTPFLENSLTVTDVGGAFTVESSLLDSTATDRHVTVTVDENNRATVRFGNGINAVVPSGTILFSYKTGGGILGNVDVNTITRSDANPTNGAILSVTNLAAAGGGAARESTEAIRVSAPLSVRALTRTVAREDFEIHANAFAGVARSVMLTSNERPAVQENQGQLVLVPEGGGAPSTVLKDDVKALFITPDTPPGGYELLFPMTITFILDVIDATYLPVNVFATVQLAAGGVPAIVDAAIRAALTEFFAIRSADGSLNPDIDFGFNLGGSLAFSDIYNVVRDIPGIARMGDGPADFSLNLGTQNVQLEPYEFPTLGTVTIINDVTGSALV